MNDLPHAADCDAPPERRAACLVIATVVSTLGGFLFGYDNLVISGAIDYLTRSYGLDKTRRRRDRRLGVRLRGSGVWSGV